MRKRVKMEKAGLKKGVREGVEGGETKKYLHYRILNINSLMKIFKKNTNKRMNN